MNPGLEIERKYLLHPSAVTRLSEFVDQAICVTKLTQGYLTFAQDGAPEARIRLLETLRSPDSDERGRHAAVLTVKGAGTLVRTEIETPIAVPAALAILAQVGDRRLEKIRHCIPLGDLTVEVDVFHGPLTGLVVAEIELAHADQAVPLPAWLGDEITEDGPYRVANLVRSAWDPLTATLVSR